MQGGKVDKFMAYTKPGLRGLPVRDYRDAATATNKHYDTHKFPGHVHKNCFLLKLQPQQGKTGAAHGQAIMQDAWCLLCRWSMSSMQTWLVLGSAHFNVDPC